MLDAEPQGWERLRLRDLFRERKERGQPSVPVASVSIDAGLVLRSTLDRRVSSALAPEEHALVRKNDIAYNMMRMWQGACGLASADCIVSPAYVVMTPGPKIRPDFALEMLRSTAVVKKLHAYSQGVVDDRLRLYPDAFGQIPVLIPPLDDQRQIAEILRSLDKAISSNLNALSQVERSRSAILRAALEEADCETVPLGELGEWKSGSTPSKRKAENWGGGIPWICPRDMKVPVISKSLETLSKSALGGSCRIAPAGTLLLVVRGMILARAIPTAITAVEAAYNQDVKAFVPNGRASAQFVQMCIQHQEPNILRMISTASHGTKKLDADVLSSLPIPLPDHDAQKSIVGTVAKLDEATVYYGAEHLRLSEARRGLSDGLMSGRLRVPA